MKPSMKTSSKTKRVVSAGDVIGWAKLEERITKQSMGL